MSLLLHPLALQVSCSSDGSVALWDPELRQQLGHFLGHQHAVSAVVAMVRRRWRAHWGSLGRLRGLWEAGCMGYLILRSEEVPRVRCLGLNESRVRC